MGMVEECDAASKNNLEKKIEINHRMIVLKMIVIEHCQES